MPPRKPPSTTRAAKLKARKRVRAQVGGAVFDDIEQRLGETAVEAIVDRAAAEFAKRETAKRARKARAAVNLRREFGEKVGPRIESRIRQADRETNYRRLDVKEVRRRGKSTGRYQIKENGKVVKTVWRKHLGRTIANRRYVSEIRQLEKVLGVKRSEARRLYKIQREAGIAQGKRFLKSDEYKRAGKREKAKLKRAMSAKRAGRRALKAWLEFLGAEFGY